MYYLYKKSKGMALPKFHYMFTKFEDFYDIQKVLTCPLLGTYTIRIKTDNYNDIISFIEHNDMYKELLVYIEVSESLLEYLRLQKPTAPVLDGKSSIEVFKELIEKHSILFDKNVVYKLFYAIEHTYQEMEEALLLIKKTFPNKEVTIEDVSSLFVIDNLTYPRSVVIQYIRMEYHRKFALNRSIEHFGNDIVFYAMRKNIRSLMKDKINYLKTGKGSNLIKSLSTDNIIRMMNCFDYCSGSFRDVRTILNLYEEGKTVNDTLQERTYSSADEECYAP